MGWGSGIRKNLSHIRIQGKKCTGSRIPFRNTAFHKKLTGVQPIIGRKKYLYSILPWFVFHDYVILNAQLTVFVTPPPPPISSKQCDICCWVCGYLAFIINYVIMYNKLYLGLRTTSFLVSSVSVLTAHGSAHFLAVSSRLLLLLAANSKPPLLLAPLWLLRTASPLFLAAGPSPLLFLSGAPLSALKR